MIATAELASANGTVENELITFYVGDLLLGTDIAHLEEINRHLDITAIPHAAASVRGVVNLRGDVVTVLDLRTILGLERADISRQTRNVVVAAASERIGLLVDRVADVVHVCPGDMELLPANARGAEARFFKGVYKLEKELLVVLDVEAVLAADSGVDGDRARD